MDQNQRNLGERERPIEAGSGSTPERERLGARGRGYDGERGDVAGAEELDEEERRGRRAPARDKGGEGEEESQAEPGEAGDNATSD